MGSSPACALALVPLLASAASFRQHPVAADLKGGYQVVVSDMNGDGRPDLIALASGLPELVWYENPGWRRHVIAGGFSRLINLVVVDADTIVLAAGFDSQAARSSGEVFLLERNAEKWSVREIDRLPTAHRLRLADLGNGRRIVVNAPLTGASAAPPDYRGPTPLVYYQPGEWKRRQIGDEDEGVMHGIFIADWDGDGRDDILTASFSGIHLYRFAGGRRWIRSQLARGDSSPWPKCGASDLAVGHLGKQRFITAIEPWHGNQVTVYRNGRREVLDDSFVDGHTIVAADLDGDKRDEIVAGFRARPFRVYIYAEKSGRWQRTTLDDGGMGAAACAVADLNADRRPDIACIGSATANLKWYENVP